jgi:hypothetical protein
MVRAIARDPGLRIRFAARNDILGVRLDGSLLIRFPRKRQSTPAKARTESPAATLRTYLGMTYFILTINYTAFILFLKTGDRD